MKKFTYFLFFSFLTVQVFGQILTTDRVTLKNDAPKRDYKSKPPEHKNRSTANRQNIVSCDVDTIFYTDAKSSENIILLTVVGAGNGMYPEGLAQWFEGPQDLAIHGVQFYGRSKYSGTTAPVNVSIYAANADSTPGTMLGSAATTLNYGTTFSALRRNINFSNPIMVNGPYLVVVEGQANSSDTIQLVTTNQGDGYGERLSKFRVLGPSGTVWLDVGDEFGLDADFYTFPLVSYNLSSRFSFSPNLTTGSTINFTNQSSPIFFSRFYNLDVLSGQPEQSFYWNFGENGDYGTAVDTSHVYNTPGIYSVTLESYIYGWRNFYSDDFCFADSTASLTIVADPMPVTITTYDVKGEKNRVKIMWSTSQELNNARYEVERSADGRTFTSFSKIQAGANSSTSKSYNVYDDKPISGMNYYRLVQYDKDGNKTYFPVKTIDFKVAGFVLLVYPNPASTEVFIRSNYGSIQNITITDVSGRLVKTITPRSGSNNGAQSISVNGLAEGVYLVQVNANGQAATQKLVIKK